MRYSNPSLEKIYRVLKENYSITDGTYAITPHRRDVFEVGNYTISLYERGSESGASISSIRVFGGRENRYVSVDWLLRKLDEDTATPLMACKDLLKEYYTDIAMEDLYEVLDYFPKGGSNFVTYTVGSYTIFMGRDRYLISPSYVRDAIYLPLHKQVSVSLEEMISSLEGDDAKHVLFNLDLFKKYLFHGRSF